MSKKDETYRLAFLSGVSILAPARKILTPHTGVLSWDPEKSLPVGVLTCKDSYGKRLKAK